MRRQLVTGLLMTIAMIVLLGLVYPLAMTGVAQGAHEGQGQRLVRDARTARSSARR